MMKYSALAIVIILGLCFGSFINAYVWRTKLKSSLDKKEYRKSYTLLRGRSMCPNCRHVLSPLDLVPVFSWLYLTRKCRYCHKAISAQYPVVEILTMLLFLLSYLCWPIKFNSMGISYLII